MVFTFASGIVLAMWMLLFGIKMLFSEEAYAAAMIAEGMGV